MKEPKGKILLEAKGETVVFDRSHAERLMRFQDLKGRHEWKVSEDSKYEYKDNGFINRGSKKSAKKSDQ